MKTRITILVLTAAAVVCGCLERTPYVTGDSSDKISKYLLDRPPQKIEHPTDATMDQKVVMLGYDLVQKTVVPGEKLEVTWYWQCLSSPGPGWRLFTHAHNAKGKSQLNVDEVGPIRRHFQPEYWRPGLVIRDVQSITVPKDWKTDYIELRTGLWSDAGRMTGKGKSVDKSNRIKGPRVKVVKSSPITTTVLRAPATPVIDGQFENEAAWKNTTPLDSFKHTMSGQPVERTTEVRLMWDDDNLYVAMRADDDYLKSRYTKHDDELWNEDVFEVFLDPGGDQKNYYELQVSPAGIIFDSHLPQYRQNRNEWSSQMVAKVKLDGKVNQDKGDDKGWSAELAIPFASLNTGGGVPPKAEDKWRVNFFRVDITKERPQYSAWSPPMRGDFHALDKFGTIVFSASDTLEKAEKAE
jgi:hypothetical protein